MISELYTEDRFYSIAEIELLNNGERVALDNVKITANFYYPSNSINNLIDGNHHTIWHIDAKKYEPVYWVNMIFGTPVFFDEIRLNPRKDIPQQMRVYLRVKVHESSPLFDDYLTRNLRFREHIFFHLKNLKRWYCEIDEKRTLVLSANYASKTLGMGTNDE